MVGAAAVPDLDRGFGRDHQRALEQRVGGVRDHEQRLDVGPHDRPAGGERVGGGAGRRRAQHAVAAEPQELDVVDGDRELEQALPRALLHRRLVQRPVALDDAAVQDDLDLQGEPLVDVVVAVDDRADRGVEVGRSVSARNPTWPRLTPSSGTPAGRANSAARRNVPSPPSTSAISAPSARGRAADQLDLVLQGRVDGLDPLHPDLESSFEKPKADSTGLLDDVGPPGMGDEQSRSHTLKTTGPTSRASPGRVRR